MNLPPASNPPSVSSPASGSLALVSYLPDPLGPFLTGLRNDLTPAYPAESHVTLLPPRKLVTNLDLVASDVGHLLSAVEPFEIELHQVEIFPLTNILYLTLSDGHASVSNLHDSLNQGRLFSQEHFDFLPHVTLSGPLAGTAVDATLDRAREIWNGCPLPRRVVVSEVSLLWQNCNSPEKDWLLHSSFSLAKGERPSPNL